MMSGLNLCSAAGAELSQRIAAIEANLGRLRAASTAADRTGTNIDGEPNTTGFDAFGAVYQAAIASVTSGPAPVAAPVFWPAFGPTGTAIRVATRGTVRTEGPPAGQIGGYGAMPVPADLAAYGNGNIPSSALESIGQGAHRLWAPAAADWRSAVAAASADGVELRVTDSYRSYADQVQLAENKGLYTDGGLAAVPGTSNHGWGRALDVDVDNPAALRWLQANGHRYGFVQAVTREPWHWEYRPDQA